MAEQDEARKPYTIAIPADTTGPRALSVSLTTGGVANLTAGGEGVVDTLTAAQVRDHERAGLAVAETPAAPPPTAKPKAAPAKTEKPVEGDEL